jgi:ribosomal-protein-alanine N-acetyltransferase
MRSTDLDAVLEIAGALAGAPKWGRDVYLAALSEDEVPQRVALVAELDGALAGFLIAAVVAGEAELESIGVAPAAQRAGTGTALLSELIAEVSRVGASEILLEVRESNLVARRLYARSGFAEVGRRRGYYAHPVEDAVLMRLEL